jgi:dynein heavy chain 2
MSVFDAFSRVHFSPFIGGILFVRAGFAPSFDAAVRATLESRKLQSVSTQLHKLRQLHEALNQRMGCVLVGPSGCGKSTLLNVLHDALTQKLGVRIVRFVLNPKAMDRSKLLGRMDADTREWFDGVLTAAARAVVREVCVCARD